MTDRVLKRYELQTRQVHLEPLYPGAEVWLGRDTQVGLPATIIAYPWAPEHLGSSTARALWSAELRKLFRLSCQPFDPSLVGFVNGGFDEPIGKLVLVTQDADLPSVQAWLSDGLGKSCASQWRGNHAPNRAELWDHIAGLFGALSSIHESRIVHRRIQPHNILVDEALSRDQPGFLKLGRFEASTFFRNPAPPGPAVAGATQVVGHDPWYAVDLGAQPARGPMLSGTPAGDVYGLSLTALWLLSERPKDNPDLYRFLVARSKDDSTEALRIRREVVQEAVKQLFTPEERRFFEPLLSPKFALTASASRYRDRAEEVAGRLRESALTAEGPLCLVLSWKAEDRLSKLWKDPSRPWRGAWLEETCRQGRFLPSVQDASANKYQAAVLLPNGWTLLCAVFLAGGGLDWNRLSINDVVEYYHRPSSGEPVNLAPYAVRILQGKQFAPANARPWRPFFIAAAQAAKGTASPVQEALEQLNFAELAFWEEKVVPVRVRKVQVTAEGGHRKEEIEIEQLLEDKEFPPNPPIRQPQPPDFAAILEDKNLTRTRIELSETPDLWDRERQQACPVEAQWQVQVDALADRPDGPLRALQLVRTLAADEEPTPVGFRGYFKTSDQPWQMGLFRRRRQALESLHRHAILADILRNPLSRQRKIEPLPLHLGYDRWSEEKDRVVSSTLATAPLFLVQGPPGTGKSTYVIGLMRHILSPVEDPNARIFVVAQMHSAIDDMHDRVQREFAGAFRGSSWDRPLLLRLRTPRNEEDEERTDREMAKMARELFQECLEILVQRGDEGFRLALRGLRQELEAPRPSPELQARMIEAASIIFTTCTDKHLDAVSRTDFDWVIVEEAGRLVGCDLIIPMRLGHRWVLIGDPNQMGPYRQEDFRAVMRRELDRAERENELQPGDRLRLEADGLSLLGPFETLFSTLDASQREMLTQQHRMHPQIRQVVSNAFYGGKLCDDPDTAGKMPFLYPEGTPILGAKAVLWLDVPHLSWPNRHSTEDQREKGGFSWSNPAEVQVIRCLLRHLAVHRPSLPEGVAQVELAAITPYKRQRRLITQALRGWQSPDWIKLVEGGEAFTATAYQGHEADVVVLSMGRNNYRFESGFLDRKQMNVALSRARRLLVVVGCFRMLEERAKSHEADNSFVATLVQELRPYVVPAHEAFPEVST